MSCIMKLGPSGAPAFRVGITLSAVFYPQYIDSINLLQYLDPANPHHIHLTQLSTSWPGTSFDLAIDSKNRLAFLQISTSHNYSSET